jgi:hypothetical protein
LEGNPKRRPYQSPDAFQLREAIMTKRRSGGSSTPLASISACRPWRSRANGARAAASAEAFGRNQARGCPSATRQHSALLVFTPRVAIWRGASLTNSLDAWLLVLSHRDPRIWCSASCQPGFDFALKNSAMAMGPTSPESKERTTLTRMKKLADDWLPKPLILHPWPNQRFAVLADGCW